MSILYCNILKRKGFDTRKNKEITIACIEHNVKKYEIADYLKISVPTLVRKLRYELPEEEKQKFLNIILEISKGGK